MAVFSGIGRIHHARDMARCRKHETLRAFQVDEPTIGRFPGRDVILPRRQHIDRQIHLAEIDRHALQCDATRLDQLILLIHLPKIEAVHRRRHAGAVAVPIQQVEGKRLVAEQVVIDHEGPDEIVGPQHVEGRRHLGAFEIAAPVHLFLHCLDLLFVDEDAQLPGFGEIQQRHEERGGSDATILLDGHPGERARQQRAAQAIANGIDLALARRGLDPVQGRQDAVLHVVAEILGREILVRIDPANHEDRMALRDRPFHEAVFGPQVEDIIFVDPGRHDQQRPLQHIRCRRIILDELHQRRLPHHLARRGGNILAQPEGLAIRHADAKIAFATFQVGQQVGETLQQVLATGFHRLAQHLRIGQQEVAGAQRIDELAGIEIDLLRHLWIEPVDILHHVGDETRGEQVALLDKVEDLVVLPSLVLETAILGIGLDYGCAVDAHDAPRRVLPQRHVILPQTELGLHQAARIGHQTGRHLQEGAADIERVGAGRSRGSSASAGGLAAQPARNDPLGSLSNIGHGLADEFGIGQSSFGSVRFLARVHVKAVLSARVSLG
jgi:hypothetical protein